MTTKTVTYAELAKLLDIKPASAKKLALRKRWPRMPGNDRVTRVIVPIEDIELARDTAAKAAGRVSDTVTGPTAGDLSHLEAQIESLKAIIDADRAATERSERDWRDRLERSAAELADTRAELAALKSARRGVFRRLFG